MKLTKSKDVIILILSVAVFTFMVFPVVIASSYTFLQEDDFAHAMDIGIFEENIIKLFITAIKWDIKMYFTWQGTYTSMFLQAFLSPLNGFGLAELKIVMVVNAILFIMSLISIVYSVCKHCKIGLSKAAMLLTMCTIGIFGFTSWTEVFYWFSGAVSYSIPLSFAFIGISLTLISKKKFGQVCAAILMFIASGGSLEVAGTGCFILLMICVIKKMMGNIERKDYIIFIVSVFGAIINVIAPGNYTRHSVIDDSGLHFIDAAINSFDIVIEYTEQLFYDTPFILIIFMAILVGINTGKINRVRQDICWVIIILSSVLPFVTGFPVCLAYNGTSYFPNRCEFVEVTIIVISLVVIAINVGYILSEKVEGFFSKVTCLVLILFLIAMPSINPAWKLSELVPYTMLEQIAEDEFGNYNKKVNDLYYSIGVDENEDVFVYSIPKEIDNFPMVAIAEDMEGRVNPSIAEYYGKSSLQYVSSPLYENVNGEKVIRISPAMFECDLNYVSIFKVNDKSQEVEVIQVLEPFTINKIINIPADEKGTVGVYVFADKDGKTKLSELAIEY